MSDKALMSDRE